MVLSLPLLLWTTARLRAAAPERTSPLRWALAAPALLITVPLVLSGLQGIARPGADPERPGQGAGRTVAFANPRLAGAKAEPGMVEIYDALVDYIQRTTQPDEPIFSGLLRHDKVWGNDVLLYFAADRHAGVRDYIMEPGTARREVQRRIIDDLQRNDVRTIVLTDMQNYELNRSRESTGVTDLDDFIRDDYAVVARVGQYLILRPRASAGVACATAPGPTPRGAIRTASNALDGGATVPRDGWVKIGGWATGPVGGAPLVGVEVRVAGQPVPAVWSCLPDQGLVAAFGEQATYGGWEVFVDLRDLRRIRPGPLAIEAAAVDAEGNRHRLPADESFRAVEVAP